MEYLILIGGILSIPILHYCTRPIEFKDKAQEENKTQEEKNGTADKETSKPMPEEKLKEIKDRAKERKDRILQALTPKEQELFMEYIHETMNPKDKSSLERCFMIALILIFCLIIAVVVFHIVTTKEIFGKSDL